MYTSLTGFGRVSEEEGSILYACVLLRRFEWCTGRGMSRLRGVLEFGTVQRGAVALQYFLLL